jgi:hypothetical protein
LAALVSAGFESAAGIGIKVNQTKSNQIKPAGGKAEIGKAESRK